jgi:hypothetical protein
MGHEESTCASFRGVTLSSTRIWYSNTVVAYVVLWYPVIENLLVFPPVNSEYYINKEVINL